MSSHPLLQLIEQMGRFREEVGNPRHHLLRNGR